MRVLAIFLLGAATTVHAEYNTGNNPDHPNVPSLSCPSGSEEIDHQMNFSCTYGSMTTPTAVSLQSNVNYCINLAKNNNICPEDPVDESFYYLQLTKGLNNTPNVDTWEDWTFIPIIDVGKKFPWYIEVTIPNSEYKCCKVAGPKPPLVLPVDNMGEDEENDDDSSGDSDDDFDYTYDEDGYER